MGEYNSYMAQFNLYPMHLIPHLQGQVSQYLASQCLCSTLGDMQMAYLSHVTNV